jgi:hypothetical protein
VALREGQVPDIAIPAVVAAVLTVREVALNVGSDSGVEVGYKATIMKRVNVQDPNTKEELGKVDVPILRISITSVQSRLSVAAVNELQEPEGSTVSSIFGQQPKMKRIVQTAREQQVGMSVFIPIGSPVKIYKPSEPSD